MNVGFFTVFRADPQHLLHAALLVREVRQVMPSARIVQLTDQRTDRLPGVDDVRRCEHGPMLQRRMEHYAACDGEWLLVDTDVSVRKDVTDVFEHGGFDVALTDRDWPHDPQTADMLRTMPFNTGVVFSRTPEFWRDARLRRERARLDERAARGVRRGSLGPVPREDSARRHL
jgi:hypothetical protein